MSSRFTTVTTNSNFKAYTVPKDLSIHYMEALDIRTLAIEIKADDHQNQTNYIFQVLAHAAKLELIVIRSLVEQCAAPPAWHAQIVMKPAEQHTASELHLVRRNNRCSTEHQYLAYGSIHCLGGCQPATQCRTGDLEWHFQICVTCKSCSRDAAYLTACRLTSRPIFWLPSASRSNPARINCDMLLEPTATIRDSVGALISGLLLVSATPCCSLLQREGCQACCKLHHNSCTSTRFYL